MIINPIVAAATVAARAVGTMMPGDWLDRRAHYDPPEPPFREAFPAHQYYEEDIHGQAAHQYYEENIHYGQAAHQYYEDDIRGQAAALGDFSAAAAPTARDHPPIDAEILGKEAAPAPAPDRSRRRPPPPLPETRDPWIMLGLGPDATFDDARRAYRRCAKLYHPDMRLSPESAADAREAAHRDFARINAAFDLLKRREHEEVIEYDVYDNGARVTRSVVVSEEARDRDPSFVNYDRLADVAAYRERHPRARQWHEQDYHDRARGHGGGADAANRDASSRGKWWTHGQAFQHDHGFGHIPSNEQHAFAGGDRGGERGGARQSGRSGFGVHPGQGRGWNESPSFDHGARQNNNGYQPRTHQRFDAETKQGYPYKHRAFFEGPSDDTTLCDPTDGNPISDYAPPEHFPPRTKWWQQQADDAAIGDFAP